MNTTHAKRLLKLADYLSELPRKKFDYGFYGEERSCGTVACALGHACLMPQFQRLGARLIPDSYIATLLWPKMKDVPGSSEYDVSEQLFGLDATDHNHLFVPGASRLGSDATPKQVAKHIRKFVKERVAQ